ncbi:hypothetical protein CLOM_g22142 [Closterium sp. NIES-68]|nr:hypothetical protein CLOM_g22142 [Closterium sp. NIES-68]GJP74496.1 hypothetical protein CLOP_g5066 [Closterium sp. NIES-67]
MARLSLLAATVVLLLFVSSGTAHRGGGGPGGFGGRGGPRGGRGGGGHGPGPFNGTVNRTVTGNLTGGVAATLTNCSTDATSSTGQFRLSIFKNASGQYNLWYDASLHGVASGPPDSLAIVQGAACDASASTVLSLPATSGWVAHSEGGWWGEARVETRLGAQLLGAEASAVDAILSAVANATLPANATGGFWGGRGGPGGHGHHGGHGRGLAQKPAANKPGVKKPAAKKPAITTKLTAKQKLAATKAALAVAAADGTTLALLATNSTSGIQWGGLLVGLFA